MGKYPKQSIVFLRASQILTERADLFWSDTHNNIRKIWGVDTFLASRGDLENWSSLYA